ncbi:hypothetical protein [Wolbachia pipientis]|nr:hypothetical protein [Wolbachia pipientis]MDM8335296.1 hypothetical protein [Wolbachia pipientis]
MIDKRRLEDTNLTKSDGYYKHGAVKFFGLAAHIAFEGVVERISK